MSEHTSRYAGWTVAKLKAELGSRGASLSGRKEALIERLEAYDRNRNFRNDVIDLPDDTLPNWPDSGFKQLVKDHLALLPKLEKAHVEAYFKFRVASDNDMAKDFKSLTKGQQLLDSLRVLACSIHIRQTDMYLTGMVGAAMKKKVSYSFKVRINKNDGEVLNTHCECPSGKGPHSTCKHVAAVLLMIAQFIATGEIQVKKSCTENVQSFHAPKRAFEGSPCRAESLPGEKRSYLENPIPPALYREEGYEDEVRSIVLNYCANTSSDISMRYRYDHANLAAAVQDHDYLKEPFTHHWVDTVVQVTNQEASSLEKATRLQFACSAWHEAREFRITASHFGDIAQMTERRNKEKLCELICNPPTLKNAAIVHGLKFESVAKRCFEKQSGLKVKLSGLFVRPDFPWLGASPDGIIDNESIIEIKCPYKARDCIISAGKDFRFLQQIGSDVTLKETHKYYQQIQGQLFLSERKFCYFIVYTHVDLFVQKITIDTNYCQHSLIPKLELFYTKYFRPYLAKNKFYGQ